MRSLCVLTFVCSLACSRAAPAATGEQLFKQRCAVCHLTTSAGAQGPGLGGVVGRTAGTSQFGFSKALRESRITWDPPTLDAFLAAPQKLVPGTSMVVTIPDPAERRDIVLYLATLRGSGGPAKEYDTSREQWTPAAPGLRTGAAAMGDFRTDGPGVRRHLVFADLPQAFATESARNSPKVVSQPSGAQLLVPPGFKVELFAKDLVSPRLLRTAPNGDIFVAESAPGRIQVLHDGRKDLFAGKLDQPFGIAFYPPGSDPKWVYVAENNAIIRFPYRAGDRAARGGRETVVPKLSNEHGGHWTRDVTFSPDGKQMFVSVGSASNYAERMPKRPVAEAQAFEKTNALGSAWDAEDHRADVLVFDAEGKSERIFATGIRNCVGLAVHPKTGDLWCSTNERDGLGDDLVPDYVTRVKDGGFYGWPWYWLGTHEDPRLKGERPDLAGKVTAPDVLVQAHSASLQLTFYDGKMFPAGFRGDGFAAFHGSWNRARRTGYKVVRVLQKDGVPTGEYEDFLVGFVADG
ncbi:MAG TPA: PQQ-dependent sugar dehydrogenase, partial [Myxococcales bacterium]|nr:PQQ-dependent sugar dehydrogenase [Myxococcales bacterium]